MKNITPLNVDTAPADSRDLLAKAQQNFGFVPNLLGNMAHAPSLLKAYLTLSTLFDQTSLSPTERQVVLLATSTQNNCQYCVAAHTAIAGMQNVPGDVVEAIRKSEPIPNPKLEALREFVQETVETRGWPSSETEGQFLDAGFTEAQALEVLVGIGMKTLSNYTNHLSSTPLDSAFEAVAWDAPVSA